MFLAICNFFSLLLSAVHEDKMFPQHFVLVFVVVIFTLVDKPGIHASVLTKKGKAFLTKANIMINIISSL